MCLNLELTPLSQTASALCESVRNEKPTTDIYPLFKDFKESLEFVIEEIALAIE